jgi:WD40 repeat protein
MARVLLAACAALLVAVPTRAAEPKPLWEIPATGGDRSATPGWLGYSPDGKAVVAVVVREGAAEPREYKYQLRVWDARSRKERFSAELGVGKAPHRGDDLAAFPSDDTVMTGGSYLTVRNLENGGQTETVPTGGLADFSVWAVPDVRESFHLRRDPNRYGLPLELCHNSPNNRFNEFDGRLGRGRINQQGTRQTTLQPPRDGMRADAVTLNPGRTRVAAAFRDESPTSRPRHALILYRIKTVDEFDLDPVAEATNPHPGPVTAMAFARNGRTLATGGEDGSVCLWDVEAAGSFWKPRATVAAADHRVYAMAYSPDWRFVAAVTWDKAKPNLLLIDADAGKLVAAVRLERQLMAVAWSPDGATLLTAGASGTIQAWDAATLLKGN